MTLSPVAIAKSLTERNRERSVGHDACQPGCVVASPDPSIRQRRVGALNRKWIYNGKPVDQGIARKAKQKPEGEMEGTKTAAAWEAF